MNAIFERVSIRRFRDTPVEQEKIEKILRAAMQSPSAGNQQPWEFLVVKDRSVLEKLAETSEYAAAAGRAAVVIVNVCRTENLIFPEAAPLDMAVCTENEWLEAVEQGLGAVWVSLSPFEDRVKMAGEILGLPEGKYAFSMLAAGYPGQRIKVRDRYDASRVTEI